MSEYAVIIRTIARKNSDAYYNSKPSTKPSKRKSAAWRI
jgi:hypothetical protein